MERLVLAMLANQYKTVKDIAFDENVDISIRNYIDNLSNDDIRRIETAALVIRENIGNHLNELATGILDEEEITANGIVLTPTFITDLIVEKCKKYILGDVLLAGDICSGMGSFIYSLNNSFPKANTFSFEKNKKLFQLSSATLSSSRNKILNCDTLFDTGKYYGTYDLIVGNPPYVRLQNIDDETKSNLQNDERYKPFLFGAYDLSIPFIIKCFDLLKDGGIAGLIIPRKIYQSSYGEKICKYLYRHTRILEILDFGDNQIFNKKTTYTSIIIFKKEDVNKSYTFKYGKMNTLGRNDKKGIKNHVNIKLEDYSSNLLSNFPWIFSCDFEIKVMDCIRKNGTSINDVFNMSQGFRTGNNKAYVVGDAFENEPCIIPYVDGTNIKRGFICNSQRIIWPYSINEKGEIALNVELFIEQNPKSYQRILMCKQLNDARSNDVIGYSRPQNLSIMSKPKVLVKEMMPRAELAADTKGEVAYSSGYALVPIIPMSKEDITTWSMILSTSIMEYQYRCIGTNLHSGWFRMYKNHFTKVIVPNPEITRDKQVLSIKKEIESNYSNENAWASLNDIVASYLGVDSNSSQKIDGVLNTIHKVSIPKEKSAMKTKTVKSTKKYIDDVEKSLYGELTDKEREQYYPVELTCFNCLHVQRPEYRRYVTYQIDKTAPIQRWYKYTQGYSTRLVDALIDEMHVTKEDIIFDPFCGGGTTLLAASQRGIKSFGCDISPLSCWISNIKTHYWTESNRNNIEGMLKRLNRGTDFDFSKLLFQDFFVKAFYPSILAQTLYIREWINQTDLIDIEKDFLRLALVSIQEDISLIRKHGSHYRFLNDSSHVGVNVLNIELIDEDADVIQIFKNKVEDMLLDISTLTYQKGEESRAYCSDFKSFVHDEKRASVVITSPPYLNRNNYFAQQKAELSLLNLVKNYKEYVELVKHSFCSHVEANLPEKPTCVVPEVNLILEKVMCQKSNNAKIPHMIAGYFNELDTFFKRLPNQLSDHARLAFVVGNCRWNGVVVPVDHLLCRIAEQYGFQVEKIMVARLKGNSPQQMSEYGRIPVRESIVVLSYSKENRG